MGLNLSRGEPIKYYSSDRITQIIGNGLVTLIDERTKYRDFFNENEMVFYKNLDDLINKIYELKDNINKVNKISENGKKRYFELFDHKIVSDFLISKIFETSPKYKYGWK